MAKSYGWAGKVLQVDLANGIINKAPTADYRPEEFIGGVGLNAKIFWELGCPKVDAFDLGNPLIISVGPLQAYMVRSAEEKSAPYHLNAIQTSYSHILGSGVCSRQR